MEMLTESNLMRMCLSVKMNREDVSLCRYELDFSAGLGPIQNKFLYLHIKKIQTSVYLQ